MAVLVSSAGPLRPVTGGSGSALWRDALDALIGSSCPTAPLAPIPARLEVSGASSAGQRGGKKLRRCGRGRSCPTSRSGLLARLASQQAEWPRRAPPPEVFAQPLARSSQRPESLTEPRPSWAAWSGAGLLRPAQCRRAFSPRSCSTSHSYSVVLEGALRGPVSRGRCRAPGSPFRDLRGCPRATGSQLLVPAERQCSGRGRRGSTYKALR